jgi:hypothetical protein
MPASEDVPCTERDPHEAEAAYPVIPLSFCREECCSILTEEQSNLELGSVEGTRRQVREKLLHLPVLGLRTDFGDVVDLHELYLATFATVGGDGDCVVDPFGDLRLHVTGSEEADPPLYTL